MTHWKIKVVKGSIVFEPFACGLQTFYEYTPYRDRDNWSHDTSKVTCPLCLEAAANETTAMLQD